MVKKVLKIAGWIVGVPVLAFVVFLIYVTAVDYKPDAQVKLNVVNNPTIKMKQGEPFTVTTFNIGYAGNDQGQDFFLDGGTMSRSSSKEQTELNLAAITSILKDTGSNMYMLQEVDKDATRSNRIDEVERLSKALPEYSSVFATNYKVPWVLVPVMNPMGKVHAGLMTMSTFESTSHTRYDLPGKEKWPVQLMELDRAFIESRFPVENGKELVLLNVHLSAYDKGGKIRKQQLDFLKTYIETETKKGNYIIAGGDWNHSLPGSDPAHFGSPAAWPAWLQSFPKTFEIDGFQWAIDPNVPSVRELNAPYKEGVNFLALIDGFYVSSNIKINSVKGHDLTFKHSDHNPITGTFILE
ncbi:endonuclease/exonuclease/phosphatase family protein [Paenibacillus sp. GSMTC-2017]|uniref:endonuclease/exonuclease/phosphatase family protein n=1 Tax=Paenibacillus sp. GSMTC-2017 TaxID=2794350 RepID=UPI0018DA0478|nr:endonuclease/exonuclease/phosphatase family protein [Paenibacillus sp. GSMTC-2017]MBH5320372.1 endonuclease/exonuclease/phosphatase family protein [Paenibacillus sp. GSMTC-2017]